ncbi:MAG: hypothetical protein BroJett040_06780 [Oligoflexia bacterium]|nr:MAG: hypothetical protein BroJett040_06780 [Oligoflexia bacterium]
MVDGQKVQRYPLPEAKYIQCLPAPPPAPWKVMKPKWEAQDEASWQDFVRSMGKAVESRKCDTVDSCMISRSNPYRSDEDIQALHYSDCADLPMYLRAYFAYKNRLPFSMVTSVEPNEMTEEQLLETEKKRAIISLKGPEELEKFEARLVDVRYSRNGNYPKGRSNVPHSRGIARDFFKYAELLHDSISTASYRMYTNVSGGMTTAETDFYAPVISSDVIPVGTVLYTAAGHVALVYDIRPNGEIMTLNAAPGNALTVRPFNREFERSHPNHGAGFKKWRPFELVNYKIEKDGSLNGGQFVFISDYELPDFSLEQYFGNKPDEVTGDWRNGLFMIGDRKVSYTDYVKIKMANGVYKLNPLAEFRRDVSGLCLALQDRTRAVEQAMTPSPVGELFRQPHPDKLPDNIYGASGDWETYSTPGGDLRIRSKALDVITAMREYISKWINRDPYLDYQGKNLKFDLLKIFNQVDASCKITYKNSEGRPVSINSLSLALSRLPRLSFDPYNCPELRWGARHGAEVRSCTDDQTKIEWYTYSQFLRNAAVRDPNEVMGWDLDGVKRLSSSPGTDIGIDSEKFNIRKVLEAL